MPSRTASSYEEHAHPQGPGDARPTALQIVHDNDAAGSMADKVILITGCSSGIGVETARALHATGARLFLTVRDVERGRAVVNDIMRSSSETTKIELIEMHLESLESVRRGAQEVMAMTDRLNIVINNAGVMAAPFTLTKDGYELHFGVNHLAHFILTHKLLPLLLRSSTRRFHSRVINITSVGHRSAFIDLDGSTKSGTGYDPFLAYGWSKTANIWVANELERRYGNQGLHGLSVHPGGIATSLQRHLPKYVRDLWTSPEIERNLKSVEQGAATTVFAAVSKSLEGDGALYLENCKVSSPAPAGATGLDAIFVEGFAKHAFNPSAERRLWNISCEMMNVEDKYESFPF